MQKAAIDKCTLEIEIVQIQFPHHHPMIWIFGSIRSYSKQLFPTSNVISWSHVNCRLLNQVFEVDISFSPCSVVLKVGSRWFSQVNWCWSSARAASVPVSTSCLWCLPASVRIGRWQGGGQWKDGAQTRHYPRPPCHHCHPGITSRCWPCGIVA